MRLFLVGLAFVAVVAAGNISPPLDSLAVLEEIEKIEPSGALAQDGYRYRTIRRLRHRRDVGEAQYLPPVQELALLQPDNQYLAPIEAIEPVEQLADDGYRYKTVKRLRHRNRRDVSELSSAEYLPPVQEEAGYSYPAPGPIENAAPVQISSPVAIEAPIQESAELANDGYRYKTVKRIRYRKRRDVSELQSGEYLPPVDTVIAEPDNQYLAPAEISEPIEQIAEDGYRYKTVKRLRYRNRRDVSELASNDYLPPVSANAGYSYPAPAPVEVAAPAPIAIESAAPIEVSAPLAIEPSAELASDGYRYKTVRRIRYRHRRDVSELPSEYLPPTQGLFLPEPTNEYLAPVEEIEQLADDGYRYKTVKRLRHRHRRDVNELASAEYLPPVQEQPGYSYPAPGPVEIPAPIEIAAPIETPAPIDIPAPIEQSAELANDGYRYKTVRRIRYRHRRDVNELPTNDYLPPVGNAPAPVQPGYSYNVPAPVEIEAPVEVQAPVEIQAPAELGAVVEESAALADDGYRYKTVRRIRYRHRRDVSELPAVYLPPAEELSILEPNNQYLAPLEAVEQFADDGYRYKTVKRLRHRNRRDVSELSSAEYLPPQPNSGYSYPAPAPVEIAPVPVEIPAPVSVEPTVELADDGYRYKTVRRIRYRHRRDVHELPAEYLPPLQEHSLPEPGNQYLPPVAHVNELPPSLEYLPPAPVPQPESGYSYPIPAEPFPASVESSASIEVPTPSDLSAGIGDEGYQYKTVKRIRYRNRRDVNELLSGEYLPPGQESGLLEPSNEYLAPAVAIEEPLEQIAEDGYRYKTVKKYKIKRH